ncbi:tripartite tricarboxylate transporter TctB family protein [Alkalihalobacillus oceani]|uniref:tripartite tricarboxylate transporter TctB family protein n=1 Tax=Halalkalibacter oceani TaxID=1653776 RepID=UPI00203D6DB1|nr:tripartite tricarboxylate transporter TctB family protein [Halalkalibacter oceani]MCM3761988.1 tripartite tricarboxylate transporter TctB family protein [Halalkalibacter oceani]
MSKNDRYIGLGIMVVGLYMLLQTFWVNYTQFPNEPGPVLMPRVIGGGLILCGFGLLLWPSKRGQETGPENEQEEPEYIQKGSKKRMLSIVGAFVGYIALLNIVGFVVSTLIFLTFSIWFLNPVKSRKSFIIAATTSIIVTLTVNFSFSMLLNIRLPNGMF